MKVDFRGLIKDSEAIQIKDSHLRWHDWERYSARQDTRMKLGGFIGRIDFSGDLSDFWPYLSLGEFIHVGKGSSFGLGKYEILS
ncbi:MAG: CRISPR system precrRNA processing endoribonuclease RAMP protein Cas6 [Deltaproteobacteria bacterium]|nr:CRISPR system precrRNA processing endoribonuclease RAMP protein Cas6 [Deltaproteobacteria bacterium]